MRIQLRALAAALASLSVLLAGVQPAAAHHGDIHASCKGEQPVIKERPPGTEDVIVQCVRGQPEFLVDPDPVPVIDPVVERLNLPTPPDFGGWVTVWMKVP